METGFLRRRGGGRGRVKLSGTTMAPGAVKPVTTTGREAIRVECLLDQTLRRCDQSLDKTCRPERERVGGSTVSRADPFVFPGPLWRPSIVHSDWTWSM